ncbi:Na+/H+ antiporter NhaA [Microbacterium betulae]|uniref:Na(+)/H(+) antiporter NhaA n=1 Tax=Microbacterium betulae TaxID=2981139 RepID=A0AA97FIY2_9MICO|nr:Na+/H+ antiporter NhaA [Microbacterium sp. AB]WOF24351.1 Na+/H+ antiporter NhaA [Microbacterium sp. AB]
MLRLLRSERFPAFLLLGAAALGLVVANSAVGPSVIAFGEARIGVPGTPLDLSIAHWVADFLLAIFFFGVAVELQYELTNGHLNTVGRAVRPAIAAAGGVLVPIVVYLAIAGAPETASGWPIPTATDIAFALGVLAVFGRGLPSRVRVFLLALAIIDDIAGIVFIAVLFATDVDLVVLLAGVALAAAFALLSRVVSRQRAPVVVPVMIVVALGAWALVYLSGVHATIAGVLLGLAVRQGEGMRARHVLEPWINGAILPLFAFFAALVVVPQVALHELSPALWATLVALPVGKLVGIVLFGWLAMLVRPRGAEPEIRVPDLLAAGALGGIGFTVSLLLASLAFADDETLRDEATLGVLGGSAVAVVISSVVVTWRARHHRRSAARERGARGCGRMAG